MTFPSLGVSASLIEALGMTLIHFLWQGALVASWLWLDLRFRSNDSARRRYWMSCLALGLLLAAPLSTFYGIYREGEGRLGFRRVYRDALLEPGSNANGVETVLGDQVRDPHLGMPGDSAAKLEATKAVSLLPRTVAPWLVVLWGGGVLFLSFRLVGGWVCAHRLGRHSVQPAQEKWRRGLEELAHQLEIHRPVWLLESKAVLVPKLVGWLRPVILLPVSAAIGLSPEQLRAILYHELAHVRRHDFLVNMGQTLVETVLFYHPAVWWVSRQIRIERENCCDDLAVAHCGSARLYSEALLALETWRGQHPSLALGADDGSLFNRVRRLLVPGRDRAPRTALPGTAILAVLTLVLGLGIVRAERMPQESPGLVVHRALLGDSARLPDRELFFEALAHPVSLSLEDASVVTVLRSIASKTGLCFDVPASSERMRVSVDVVDMPTRRLLNCLLMRKEMSFSLHPEENRVTVEWWEAPGPRDRAMLITDASVSDYEDLISRWTRHTDFEADGLDLEEALREIADAHGIHVRFDQDLTSHRAEGSFFDERVFDVMESLLNAHGFGMDYLDDGSVVIVPASFP